MKKKLRSALALTVGVACGAAIPSAQAIQLDFSNLTLTTIHFDGAGHFDFLPSNTDTFRITSSDGTGDSVSDTGTMQGSWTIGAITQVSPGIYTAPITGTGTLIIHDGFGNDLTGTLRWDVLETAGTGGTLNFNGVVNLTGISYSGPSDDLTRLATEQAGNAYEVVNFHTVVDGGGTLTLPQLASTAFTSSFSGTLTAVPTPTVPDGGLTLGFLGVTLLGLEGLRRKYPKRADWKE